MQKHQRNVVPHQRFDEAVKSDGQYARLVERMRREDRASGRGGVALLPRFRKSGQPWMFGLCCLMLHDQSAGSGRGQVAHGYDHGPDSGGRCGDSVSNHMQGGRLDKVRKIAGCDGPERLLQAGFGALVPERITPVPGEGRLEPSLREKPNQKTGSCTSRSSDKNVWLLI